MKDVIERNIAYTRKNWAGHLRILGSFLYTERIHYAALFRKLRQGEGKGKNLAEIGFGSGHALIRLTRKYGFRTTGCDVAAETVDAYNRRCPRFSGAVRIDPNHPTLPFPDASIDVFLCSHVLEHVPDDAFLLLEIRRILKPSGWAYVNVPVNEEALNVPNHLRRYTTDGIESLISDSGFRILSSQSGDNFSLWINRFGIRGGFVATLLKRSLIAGLSVLPIALLERFPFRKARHICFAEKIT